MESVYRPEKRNYSSDTFKPSAVLKNFNEVLKGDVELFCYKQLEAGAFEDAARAEIRNLAKFFDISEDSVAACFGKTMPTALGSVSIQPINIKIIEEPLSDKPVSDLITNQEVSHNPYWKESCPISQKSLKLRPKSLIIREPTDDPGLVPLKDLGNPTNVYTVRVFFPVLDIGRKKNGRTMDDFLEFAFLGNQKLMDLRDVIPCINNNAKFAEFSESSSSFMEESPLVQDAYPSGLLHIGKTLYDDTRAHGTRYSKGLVEWGKGLKIPIDFKTAAMEDTTFDDLELRLGSPYVYRHFSDCEHLILFVDVRLMHPCDVSDQSLYPILMRTTPFHEERCYACDVPKSRWLVKNSRRAPVPSAFFCEVCLKRFFYKDDKKIGDFKLYRAEPDLRFTELKVVGTDSQEMEMEI